MTVPVTSQKTAPLHLVPLPSASGSAASIDPALLPPPTDVSRAELQDAMTMIYLLLNTRASAEMSNAQAQVAARQTSKDEAFKQQLDALRRAAEAEGEGSKGFFASIVGLVKDVVTDLAHLDLVGAVTDPLSDTEDMWNSPKFWQDLEAGGGFVAKAALVAGGVAATVATAGSAGLVVAGIAVALSAGGTAVQETDCLDSLLGDGASKWIGLGMQVGGGAVCLVGAGAAAGSALDTVATATEVGGNAATVVTNVAHAKNAQFRGEAMDADADAAVAEHRGQQMTRLIEWLIDGIRETDKSHARAKDTLRQAIDQHDQAATTAIFTNGRQLS
jgi:hypothetical protein